jgi:putative DNA primase/helicase
MAGDAARLVQAAMQYAALGWLVVRLHSVDVHGVCSCAEGKECRSAGKHPDVGRHWQHKATEDEETIAAWWEQKPSANVGVKFGPKSGIVDVEFDTAEGQAFADKHLAEIVTPSFRSGKSVHRLFRWSSDLPDQAVANVGGLEIRIGGGQKGAQSVFPPSRHHSGVFYEWLPGLSPWDCDVAAIPDCVMSMLWNGAPTEVNGKPKRPREHWESIAAGVGDGNRTNAEISLVGRLIRDISDPFNNEQVATVWLFVQKWNETNNPPLDTRELKRNFEGIVKAEQQRRTKNSYEKTFSRDARHDDNGQIPVGWRLIQLQTKPKVWRLYSPVWDGGMELTSDQLLSAGKIRQQAIEQKSKWIGPWFRTFWEGNPKNDIPSLAEQLVKAHEIEPAPPEQHRDLVICRAVYEAVRKAAPLGEGKKIESSDGRPYRLEDGSVYFKFDRIWKDMKLGPDQILKRELSSVLQQLGAEDFCRRYYKKLPAPMVHRLERIIAGQEALEPQGKDLVAADR